MPGVSTSPAERLKESLIMLSVTKIHAVSFFPGFLLNLQNACHDSDKLLLCLCESIPVVYDKRTLTNI